MLSPNTHTNDKEEAMATVQQNPVPAAAQPEWLGLLEVIVDKAQGAWIIDKLESKVDEGQVTFRHLTSKTKLRAKISLRDPNQLTEYAGMRIIPGYTRSGQFWLKFEDEKRTYTFGPGSTDEYMIIGILEKWT